MSAFPQYAKTSRQEVLDAIERNKERYAEFSAAGTAFAEEHGGTSFYSSRWGNSTRVAAINAEERPTTGRWKEHPRGGWLPYKNNPLHGVMGAIELRLEPIPGLPEYVESAYNSRMQHYIASPKPFVVNGEVFVGFSFVPQDRNYLKDVDPSEGGWVEIKASEWHAAAEAHNERKTA